MKQKGLQKKLLIMNLIKIKNYENHHLKENQN